MRRIAAGVCVLMFAVVSAFAQYQPIPDYSGVGAGKQFRADVNNHLSGVTPIAPRLVKVPYSQLITIPEQDGQMYACSDCGQGVTCSSGGGGAVAVGLAGQWNCAAGGASGGGASGAAGNDLSGSYPNPTVQTVQNGKIPVTTLNGVDALAAAAGNYSMGNHTLTNLLGAAASGQALVYGQPGGKLSGMLTPYVVSTSTASTGTSSLTINIPAGAVNGTDVEFAVISYQAAGLLTITAPSGFGPVGTAQCATSGGFTSCQAIYDHTVGGSEPASYTWTAGSSPVQFNGGIADVRNVNTTTPVDKSLGTVSLSSSVTLGALAPAAAGELALVAVSGGAAVYLTSPPAGLNALWYKDTAGGWGALVESFPQLNTTGTALTAQYFQTGGTTFDISEVLIQGATAAAAPVHAIGSDTGPRTVRGGLNNGTNRIDNYSINGAINATTYGADPSGSTDSSGAIQAAIAAACAAAQAISPIAKPSVYLPSGTYLVMKPLVLHCAQGGMRLYGAGKFNTTITGINTNLGAVYGPEVVAEPSNAIAAINSGTITAASLETGAGRSLYWANNTSAFSLDLGDVMRSISLKPLNGLSALDVRGFMKIGSLSSDTGSEIFMFASDGKLDQSGCSYQAGWTCQGAAQVFVDANGALWSMMNVGGTQYSVHSANSAFTLNATHEVEAVFDGSNVCLFLDGSRVATTAASGTITQRADEDMRIGENDQVFPGTGPVGRIWFSGPSYLDSFEIRKAIPTGRTCAAASYAPDTAKFGGDGNSLILLNFDNLLDINGATTTTSPAVIGADYFNGVNLTPAAGPAGAGAWLAVRNETSVAGESAIVSDLGIGGATIGMLGILSQDSQFDDLELSGAYAGLLLTNLSYNDEESNDEFNVATLAPYVLENLSGLQAAHNLIVHTSACGWACAILTGGGGVWDKLYVAPQSTTVWQIVLNNINNPAITWDFIEPSEDVENGGSAGAVFLTGPGTANFHGGGLTSAGNTPLVTIAANNPTPGAEYQALAVHGTNLNVGASTPEIVNVTGNTLYGSVLFDSPAFPTFPFASPPNAIPWSNQAGLVSVIGTQPTLQWPALPNGLQHVSVPLIADPPAPTAAANGVLGSTSYGPYYLVCRDWNSGKTNVSPASNVVTNGNATLSSPNYIGLSWTYAAGTGCSTLDILKGNTSTALATGLPGASTSYKDIGQATSAYTPPTRNTTGDLTVGGPIISSGISFANLPPVINGARYYCPNCDPPANPPAACTSAGTRTGAFAEGINGAWECAY